MSWMEKLYQTYEHGIRSEASTPWYVSHFVKTAHIEVSLDITGNLINGQIKLLSGEESLTVIPATEGSAGRAGAKIAPHPLCDEIGYCASDFPDIEQAKSDAYLTQLKNWCDSEYSHPKILAIYAYLKKQCLWHDLTQIIEFPITFTNKRGLKSKINAEKAFIRWRVEQYGNPCSGTWDDFDLIQKWIAYDKSVNTKKRILFYYRTDTTLNREPFQVY
ncbi:type I-C CRISPR-associated protein Cas8c/Csd1 [Methylocucumis oryzae]|uniref:type I-C CRISPR-associated protein Cas8c/Csd1 n=1 Tax=Methylocucumis oryzae TaxID=1632867 RepID=UPI000AD053B7|nr:type I-C CRISPR-associated protein Cas8c/Csd1 [Methylocucumis oryzae]